MVVKFDVDMILVLVLGCCCWDFVRFWIDLLILINCFISLIFCVFIVFYNVKYVCVFLY